MNLQEYRTRFPGENVWPTLGNVESGMVLFDDSASYFAGPFEGNYVFYRLHDHTQDRFGPYPTIAFLQKANRLAVHHFHRLRTRNSYGYKHAAENEDHLQNRLTTLTPKELLAWEESVANFQISQPTIDKPYAFKLAGNDDSTWTKFYATLDEAKEEVALYLIDQPLNFRVHVAENGFVFTN